MADTLVEGSPTPNIEYNTNLWGPYWIDKLTAVIVFYTGGGNIVFRRTTDGGASWGSTQVNTVTQPTSFACYFDRETPGDTGTKVHVAFCRFGAPDAFYYRSIDVSDGSLGSEVVIDNTTVSINSALFDQVVGITKAVNGNLFVALSTQASVHAWRSTDGGSNWSSKATPFETGTQEDYLYLLPANTGDDADICALFWDKSASEVSIKMYDDSADSWTETSIVTGVTATTVGTAAYRNFDAAVRHSDKHILMAIHTAWDTAGDDLLTFDINPDSIASPSKTQKANVFTDLAEAAQAAVIIAQGNQHIYIAYLKGNTLWQTDSDVWFVKSTDGMASWGTPVQYNETTDDYRVVHGGRSISADGGRIQWVFFDDDDVDLYVNLVNDIEIDAGTLVSLSETISVSDVVFLAQKGVRVSEVISMVDEVTRLFGGADNVAHIMESILVTDSIGFTQKTALISEVITVSDSAGRVVRILETIQALDSFQLTHHIVLTETITLTEAIALTVMLTIAEPVTLTDTIRKVMRLPEPITVGDVLIATKHGQRSDVIRVRDSVRVIRKALPQVELPEADVHIEVPPRKQYIIIPGE